MQHIQVTGSGVTQQVTSGRAQSAEERFDAEMGYAEKAKTHLWIFIVTHRLTDQRAKEIAAGDASATLLDVETIGVTGVGCYRCEQPLEARLVGKRCPGEPKS